MMSSALFVGRVAILLLSLAQRKTTFNSVFASIV
jgi:hypothetical protein